MMKIRTAFATMLLAMFCLISTSCKKEIKELICDDKGKGGNGHTKQTKQYSADVATRWLGVHTSMLYRPSGNPFGFNPSRYMAYCGVALYEAVLPGMPAHRTLVGQLTDMPKMPTVQSGVSYHWAASANAALATLTRKFFSLTTVYDAAAVDKLEKELKDKYLGEADAAVIQRSVEFGQEIANKIFSWAQTDNITWPTTFTIPTGPGKWKSESNPAAAPVNPFWGFNRLMVPGSIDNVIAQPLEYSTDPSSAYYANMKEVYTVSQNLTHEQKLIAAYFNDANPGYPAGAHYISTLKQLFEQLQPSLDIAAISYAKTGITLFDASTGSFKAKYTYWTERPFSYIRAGIIPGTNASWQPFLPTPNFPDYPSNHAIFSNGVSYALQTVFGNNVAFTDASYNGVMANLGKGPENLGSRYYDSFDEMADEITVSRLYGGIHYRYSCEQGARQGRRTAENIARKLKFLKD